jgi:hypothetical protein
MNSPDTGYEIRINNTPVETLSIDEGDYYTVPDTRERALTITSVELFHPSGESLARFDFSYAFAIPKGEEGMLSVLRDEVRMLYGMIYHSCDKPDYLEENRGMYVWDYNTQRMRAADYIGGKVCFKNDSDA